MFNFDHRDQLENELKTKQDVIGRLQSRWATQATRAEYAEVSHYSIVYSWNT